MLVLTAYLFTYSGRIESGDTRLLFNAVASLAEYGDQYLDKTAWVNLPDPTIQGEQYPLSKVKVEPLQLILSVPLYWLTERLANTGLVHSVWLFNVIVGVGLCGTVFCYVIQLGYDQKVAIWIALGLGIGTIAWPYTKTFFREPLAGLMILLSALFMERLRTERYRSMKWFLWSVLALGAAFLTKEAIVFAVPALLLILAPPVIFKWPRSLVYLLVGTTLVVLGMLIVVSCFPGVNRSDLYTMLGHVINKDVSQIESIHAALHSYLLAIGGSLWGTSPILILVLPGLWVLHKHRQYRYFSAAITGVMSFAIGYAVLRGDHWFGGLSWPPRFLVPIIPFLMLVLAPIFDLILAARKQRLLILIGVVLLLIYSMWVQLSAVSLAWSVYPAVLPPESNRLIEWSDGLNVVKYLRWVVIPQLWSTMEVDFAWARTGLAFWPIVCIVLVAVSSVALWTGLRVRGQYIWTKRRRFIYGALIIASITSAWLFMRAISSDALYQGDNQALHDLISIIEANSQNDDILLLADNEYEPYFLNHYKLHSPRVVTLPDPPGERPSPEQEPLVKASNPDALLVKHTIPLIHNFAEARSRLWLLASSGPWMPWSIRPVERFMTSHYYPVREFSTDPRVRLIEYATVDAPDPYAFRFPEIEADLRFGDSLQLSGVDLPKGLSYHPGDALAVSLYWSTKGKVGRDYTIAWFVADSNGVVLQGVDTQPAWGFAPTSSWEPGVPVWDNHALWLPSDMKPGQYQIWIKVYQSDNSEILLPVEGSQVIDGTIGVLPLTIEVTSP